MPQFVNFVCPVHGFVSGATLNSRVECKCGKEAAPEGTTVKEHLESLKKRAA